MSYSQASQQHLSPSKGSPSKRELRAESPAQRRVRDALRHQQSFDERQYLLRQNSKIDDQYMDEYAKTEIIRKSVNDVKKRAIEEKKRRESPEKTYGHVKSVVAKNMKSQVKGKRIAFEIERNKEADFAMRQHCEATRGQSPSKGTRSPKKAGVSPERRKQLDAMEMQIEKERVELETLKQGEGLGKVSQ